MKELRDATSISYQTTLSTLKTIYNQVKNFVMKEYHKAQALNNYYKRIKGLNSHSFCIFTKSFVMPSAVFQVYL